MSVHISSILALAALAYGGAALAQADNSSSPPPAAEYPACTAKVTDKCIEKKATAKAPVRKAAPSKLVRRDKVHRRKG
jgi:hypothetical protein